MFATSPTAGITSRHSTNGGASSTAVLEEVAPPTGAVGLVTDKDSDGRDGNDLYGAYALITKKLAQN